MRYLDNHIEEIFRPYEDTPEERLRYGPSRDKRYRMKTIRSGTMLESESYPVYSSKATQLAEKTIKTYDASLRQLYYQRTKRKNIIRLIQGNFTRRDMWGTLTYRNGTEPGSMDEAKKDAVDFIRRLKYEMKKRRWGHLKYVYVIEGTSNRKGTRYHIHIISNFPDLDLFKSKWTKGKYPKADRLEPDDDIGLERLATYLTKEDEDQKEPQHKKKSYGYSLNLYKSWQHATIADSRMTRTRAEKLATGRLDAKEFYEKTYPGYEYQGMEIRTSQYISGFYLYVKMCRKRE